jgi:hypothetical protein
LLVGWFRGRCFAIQSGLHLRFLGRISPVAELRRKPPQAVCQELPLHGINGPELALPSQPLKKDLDMDQLLLSLQALLEAGWHVVIALLVLIVPWTPLISWVAFWLLAVNWEKLYPILAKGGVIAVLLIGLTAILIWGLIAPPPDGLHHMFGLRLVNFAGKTVYVTMLVAIMALCGTVQLSGACGSLVWFPEDEPEGHHGHGDHGHDDHGHDSQGHDGHGHHDHGSTAHGGHTGSH